MIEVWSDGYCVQTGYTSVNKDTTTTINLTKSFINTDYSVITQTLATGSDNNSNNNGCEVYTKSLSFFIIYTYDYYKPVYYEAKGYIR